MAYTFSPEYLFTKGIVYAEFFDTATDNLLGYSRYITDFAPNGSVNLGEVEGGVGNMLVMCIPDTARLSFTAKTADSALNNMALTIGGEITANGVIETAQAITAEAGALQLGGAVAPLGGDNVVCYVLSSTGADKATVEAQSGIAHAVVDGYIQDFTAVAGNVYCVKYFTRNSSAEQLSIPALFAPKVVRAHFAVNCYAKKSGNDVMSSSLYKIRHYFIPYYMFSNPLQDTLGQTTVGSVDLSGNALAYDDFASADACSSGGASYYGYIVDEFVGNNSATAGVDGIYFIGLGDGVSVAVNNTVTLPIKYSVKGVLTDISDMSDVTFESSATAKATVSGNTVTGVATGDAIITASVTNSATGVEYKDTIAVTVTAS